MPIHAATAPEVIEEIRRLYVSTTLSKSAIGVETGVSLAVVSKNVADLPDRNPKKEARRLRVLELASQGMRPREIAAELKCTLRQVIRALKGDLPSSSTSVHLSPRELAIVELGLQGFDAFDIAEHLNLPLSTVTDAMKRDRERRRQASP